MFEQSLNHLSMFSQPGMSIEDSDPVANPLSMSNGTNVTHPLSQMLSQPGMPVSHLKHEVDCDQSVPLVEHSECDDFLTAILEKCQLCQKPMVENVSIAACGHMFHSSHINEWRGCPRCKNSACVTLHPIYYNPLESLKSRLQSDESVPSSNEAVSYASQVIQDVLNEQSSLVSQKHEEFAAINLEKIRIEKDIHEGAINCKLKQMEIDHAVVMHNHLITFNRVLQNDIASAELAQQSLESEANEWRIKNQATSSTSSRARLRASLSLGVTEQMLEKKREQLKHLCGSIAIQKSAYNDRVIKREAEKADALEQIVAVQILIDESGPQLEASNNKKQQALSRVQAVRQEADGEREQTAKRAKLQQLDQSISHSIKSLPNPNLLTAASSLHSSVPKPALSSLSKPLTSSIFSSQATAKRAVPVVVPKRSSSNGRSIAKFMK